VRGFWDRLSWLAAGSRGKRVPAEENVFQWVRGRVGSRQNPDGMRSVLHNGVGLAIFCAACDGLVLWREQWLHWEIFAFLHTAWVFAVLLGTALNVGFLETLDGRSLARLGIPNLITLLRAFFIPPLVYVIAARDYAWAAILYAVLTSSDAVDGGLARRTNGRTKLGVVLDPIIDASLHLSVFISIAIVGLLGTTALVLILIRSALIVFGTGLLHRFAGHVRIQPTPFGKGSGLLLAIAVTGLLGLPGFCPGRFAGLVDFLGSAITVLLGLSVIHAIAIGVVNVWPRFASQR
jgi:phosphatidylglycerophosphate synthase